MVMDPKRGKIHHLAQEYFDDVHGRKPFVPGQTYLPASAKCLDSEDLQNLLDATLDLWLTEGRFARTLERNLSPWLGSQMPAILVNSGSSANLLAISALSSPQLQDFKYGPINKGDEIITTAVNFPTTVNPIIQNGWRPIFVDVDSKTLNVDFKQLLNAVGPKTRAVVLAHTLGNPFEAEKVAQVCREKNLYLIEDCCDALGAKLNNKLVGSFGDFATLSFYPAHHITTGEGGAIVTHEKVFRKIAESFRDWGRDCWCEPGRDNTCGRRFDHQIGDCPYDHKYIYSHLGYNLKMTDMQAAIGVSQLKKVEGFIKKRQDNWQFLRKGLDQSPFLIKYLLPVEATPHSSPSWFGFAMHLDEKLDRRKLQMHLEEKRVGTRLVFAGNLLSQPAYQNIDHGIVGELKQAQKVMKQSFWMGVHPGLGIPELTYMLEQLESALKNQ